MKNKWIWIILAVILVFLVGAVALWFVGHNYMAFQMGQPGDFSQFQQRPFMGNNNFHRGMQGFSRPGSFGFFGIGMFSLMFVFKLIPWALLGLLFWGVYSLGKQAGQRNNPVANNAAQASVEPASADTAKE